MWGGKTLPAAPVADGLGRGDLPALREIAPGGPETVGRDRCSQPGWRSGKEMNLRPYQTAASDAVFKEWQENDSTLVVMPTGGGKTVLFADVIRRVFPRRALVLAHREELIFQARDKIERVTGLSAAVKMGE